MVARVCERWNADDADLVDEEGFLDIWNWIFLKSEFFFIRLNPHYPRSKKIKEITSYFP
jgi:hypothetical protein